MFDLKNNNYTSDYPPVFFTNAKFEQNNLQNNSGFFGNFLNSDLIKQILPLFLNGNTNNNLNFLSILKNINPNFTEMIKSLNMLNLNKKENKTDKIDESKNIIDLSDYENI